MLCYKEFQNEGLFSKIKNIFKEKPREDDYIAINLLKYIEKNDIVIDYRKTFDKEIYKFPIYRGDGSEFDPLYEEDYADDVNVTIVFGFGFEYSDVEQVKINDEQLDIKSELRWKLVQAVDDKLKKNKNEEKKQNLTKFNDLIKPKDEEEETL